MKYRPQLVIETGRIGDIQLVKQFLLVGNDRLFRRSRPDRPLNNRNEAELLIKLIRDVNSQDIIPNDLHVEEYWCYPKSFDPVYRLGLGDQE